MSFLWFRFKVSSMEKSIQFYKDVVGLEIQRQSAPSPTTEVIFMGDEHSMMLELVHDMENREKLEYPEHMSIGFAVDDIKEKMAEVSQMGYAVVKGPIKPNPTTEFFFVKDPNGMMVQFVKED